MRTRIVVRSTPAEVWAALAAAWREAADAAVRDHGWFAAVVSGGRTPVGFYRLLAAAPGLPWGRTHLFLADERLVGPAEPESNARLVRESLIAGLAEQPAGVHFPEAGYPDASAAATAYERRLRLAFARLGAPTPAPDLALLGLGVDGHTASLFPRSAALEERERLVAGVPAAPSRVARITLTLPLINAAGRVVVLATGADKRPAVGRVLAGDRELPAARLAPGRGVVEFFLDAAACPEHVRGRRGADVSARVRRR